MEQTDVVVALLEQLAQANATIVELSKIIADQKPEPFVFEPVPMGQHKALVMPESEEDAVAAFNAGEITKEQLEEVLREVEFFNQEIVVPSGD